MFQIKIIKKGTVGYEHTSTVFLFEKFKIWTITHFFHIMNREEYMTKDEKIRIDNFNRVSKELFAKGYEETKVGMGIVKANIIVLFIFAPIMYLIFKFYVKLYSIDDFINFVLDIKKFMFFIITSMVFIVIHELLHGLTWSLFTENGFKDVAFGFMWKYLTPYCSCKGPMKKGQYVLGLLMPLIVLGIVPTIIGLAMGSVFLTALGAFYIFAAGGDIIMAYLILSRDIKGKEVLLFDNPTEMGVSFFERDLI